MKRAAIWGTCFSLVLVYAISTDQETVEVIEIGRHNTEALPGGKEADGIIGDFVLRNGRIEALISGAQPERKANMSTEYGFVTQGCLYDLDLRDADNDQITVFRPGQLGGEVSYVRIPKTEAGAAVLEVVRTAAKGDGLYTRHEYRLGDDWQYILVTSTYRNESQTLQKISPLPAGKQFSQDWKVAGIHIGDSIDRFDKRAYAWGPAGTQELEAQVDLEPGQERTYALALAVADSPLAAYGVISRLSNPTGQVSGSAKDSAGSAALQAGLFVSVQGTELPAYPDAQGRFSFDLAPGDYQLRVADTGRDEVLKEFTVSENETSELPLELPVAAAVKLEVRDESGRSSPCKVQFIGIDGTPTPDFGTPFRAHGADHQYFSHDGRFTQQVAPGRYLLRITRGIEFDLMEREIEVAPGETESVGATLRRTVDTSGWVSTDYHSHSTPSGDNYCKTDDRIINLAAEQIEFAPTTEHNRIYDWAPHIERLGLSDLIKTVQGIELTGPGQHLNSFPLRRTPFAQDGGAPTWEFDPRINAIVLRHVFEGGADRWVQANHPIVGTVFNDRDRDGVADGGFIGFEKLIDAGEFWSTEILNLNPWYERRRGEQVQRLENRTFGWLQMLNQGRLVWCVSVSDAHRVFGNGVGGWRSYVPSSTDEPSAIDHTEIIRNSKAGRMMITNGPFLQVTTGDGLPIGSTVVSPGFVDLHVRVQTPNWIDIDRVQVLVNGRQPQEYNFTRRTHPSFFQQGVLRFDQEIRIDLQQDAHLIVVATGDDSDLSKGWGRSWESTMHPLAYTNPIFVDIDRNGFQPNGDTLGHPLLVRPQTN